MRKNHIGKGKILDYGLKNSTQNTNLRFNIRYHPHFHSKPMFWSRAMQCTTYDQTGREQNWKILDGGLYPSNTYISACVQDSNAIPKAPSRSGSTAKLIRELSDVWVNG